MRVSIESHDLEGSFSVGNARSAGCAASPGIKEVSVESLAFAFGMITGGIIALAGMALHFMAKRADEHKMSVTDGLSRQ